MTDVSAEVIRSIEPVIRETPRGWLAVSPADSPLGIGVVGGTPDDALKEFQKAKEAWAVLRDQADPVEAA